MGVGNLWPQVSLVIVIPTLNQQQLVQRRPSLPLRVWSGQAGTL